MNQKDNAQLSFALSLLLFTILGCRPEPISYGGGHPWETSVPLSVKDGEVINPYLDSVELPEEVEWLSGTATSLASPEALTGGIFRGSITSWPVTTRVVGPNSNGGFASWVSNSSNLVGLDDETGEWVSDLATHWAFGADDKTVYYKLNPNASWSDGTPVTADDYTYIMTFMQSKNIQSPWHNDFHTNVLADIKKYDDYTISIHLFEKSFPDALILSTNRVPIPSAYYGNKEPSENFVEEENWQTLPTVNPYQLNLEKSVEGEFIWFEKVPDWWGYTYSSNHYTHNFDAIQLKVIADLEQMWQYFVRRELDTYDTPRPEYWIDKLEKSEVYQKGYVNRAMLSTQPINGLMGLVYNLEVPLLKDVRIREGISYATDIDGVIKNLIRNAYTRYHNIGSGHAIGGYDYDDPDIRYPVFNSERAVELFREAGFTEIGGDGIRQRESGERLSVELLYTADSWSPRFSYIKEQALKAGLEIKLNLVNGSQGFKTVLEKKHQIFFAYMATSLIPSYWQYYHSDNSIPQTNSFSMVKDDTLDVLTLAYREAKDTREKAEISKEIQRRIRELNLVNPLFFLDFVRGGYWSYIRIPDKLGGRRTSSLFYSQHFDEGRYLWFDPEVMGVLLNAEKKGISLKEPQTIIDERYKTTTP